MAKKFLDHFDHEGLTNSLLPFLSNFLTTSILLALALVAVTRPFNFIVTIPAAAFLFTTLFAMILNHLQFLNKVIRNPTPDSITPFHSARGPRSPRWVVEFFKALSKEKRYILLGALIFFLSQTVMLVNLSMTVIKLKTLL